MFRETGVCGNERAAWMAPWVIWLMCPMGFPSCVLPGAGRGMEARGIAAVALGHRSLLSRRPLCGGRCSWARLTS